MKSLPSTISFLIKFRYLNVQPWLQLDPGFVQLVLKHCAAINIKNTVHAVSWKFWSPENVGPRTNFVGKFGPGGLVFSLKKSVPYQKYLSVFLSV